MAQTNLFSIVKVNNTLTCSSPMEIPYLYSSGLFNKEILCFNYIIECEEQHNYDDFFPYCEDCNISVENKKRRIKGILKLYTMYTITVKI